MQDQDKIWPVDEAYDAKFYIGCECVAAVRDVPCQSVLLRVLMFLLA